MNGVAAHGPQTMRLAVGVRRWANNPDRSDPGPPSDLLEALAPS